MLQNVLDDFVLFMLYESTILVTLHRAESKESVYFNENVTILDNYE